MSEIEAALAGVNWLEPWLLVGANAGALEQALQRELSAGHVLFGRSARAFARRGDRDDVLFLVADPPQLAVVHLTFSRQQSTDWPHTMLFDTVEELEAAVLQPDHEEFADGDDDA